MSSRGAAMRTSRKESSAVGRVDSEAERECGQTPAMEEGTGVKPGCALGYSVLHSPSLLSLVGEECLQLLRCSICTEFFNIPIVLPCGHTFCLQCLTDMCKQATQPRSQSANPIGTEALIGCPNCRVQIFATPILQRNVTCNFIIQSLIDTLRNRKLPPRTSVSINTERSLLGPPVRAVSEEALCGVLQDLDRLSTSLLHRSVVDDAFFEIEQIRFSHLQDLDKTSGDKLDDKPVSLRSTDTQGQVTDLTTQFMTASNSASMMPRMSFVQQQNASVKTRSQQNGLKRCYAAALTSGRDRSSAAMPTANRNTDLNARGKMPSYCYKAFPALPSNINTFQMPPFTQFGRNSNPISQNRNRNNPGLASETYSKQTASVNEKSLPYLRFSPVSGQVGLHRYHINMSSANDGKSNCQREWESLHLFASFTNGPHEQVQSLGSHCHSMKVCRLQKKYAMYL